MLWHSWRGDADSSAPTPTDLGLWVGPNQMITVGPNEVDILIYSSMDQVLGPDLGINGIPVSAEPSPGDISRKSHQMGLGR